MENDENIFNDMKIDNEAKVYQKLKLIKVKIQIT